MGQWYFLKDGKPVGPFNEDAVKTMYESGIISLRTVLWSEGLNSFEPLSNIDILYNKLQNIPPPVSPKYRKEVVGSHTKICPHCKEDVSIKAIKCMHCESIINTKTVNDENPSFNHRTVKPKAKSWFKGLYVAVATFILIFLIIFNYSCGIEPEELPPSGVMTTNYSRTNTVAPFELLSKRGSDHYYIKLYHYGSERLAASAFLRAGDKTELAVPLGAYELRWATGKDWFGTSKHFGRRTEYYKSNDVLRFTESYGWVVEFELTTGGNLERTSIDEEDF